MFWGKKERLFVGRFYDLPSVHHQYAVTEVGNYAEVMRNKNDRCIRDLTDVLHQLQNLRLNRDVKRRSWFVRNQEHGFVNNLQDVAPLVQ